MSLTFDGAWRDVGMLAFGVLLAFALAFQVSPLSPLEIVAWALGAYAKCSQQWHPLISFCNAESPSISIIPALGLRECKQNLRAIWGSRVRAPKDPSWSCTSLRNLPMISQRKFAVPGRLAGYARKADRRKEELPGPFNEVPLLGLCWLSVL